MQNPSVFSSHLVKLYFKVKLKGLLKVFLFLNMAFKGNLFPALHNEMRILRNNNNNNKYASIMRKTKKLDNFTVTNVLLSFEELSPKVLT